MSQPDDVVVVRLESSAPACARVRDEPVSQAGRRRHLPRRADAVAGGRCGSRGTRFESLLAVVPGDGTVEAVGDHLVVRDHGATTIVVAAASDFRHADHAAAVRQTIDAAVERGFDAVRADHVHEHSDKMRRVSISLGSAQPRRPPSCRPTRGCSGSGPAGDDPDLLAQYFQFGRYLLLGQQPAGDLPANLQGIWNESLTPPWDSKFTININIQMNYWPVEVANLCRVPRAALRLLEPVRESGADTAAGPLRLPAASSPTTTPISGAIPTPSTAALRACGRSARPGWRCTSGSTTTSRGDPRVPREQRAYPVMKEAAEFFLDYLVEDRQVGWSPARRSRRRTATACRTATVGCCAWARRWTRRSSGTVQPLHRGRDAARPRPRVRAVSSRPGPACPTPPIGRHGQLHGMVEDYDEPEPGHRHISHLFALYPGDRITLSWTPELRGAARHQLWSTGWRTAAGIPAGAGLDDQLSGRACEDAEQGARERARAARRIDAAQPVGRPAPAPSRSTAISAAPPACCRR